MASPGFTDDVFAALASVVNTKFPQIGRLLVGRIVLVLKRANKRNDKPQLVAALKFIAHLVMHQVVDELIALEMLTLLLENPTNDSVEVAVGFVIECGSFLCYHRACIVVFDLFRTILHEGQLDKRVQFLIEGLFALHKAAKFQGVPPELDLVNQDDQITHQVSLLDEIDGHNSLNVFHPGPHFLQKENKYEDLRKQILPDEEEEAEDDDDEDEADSIKDDTETNLINLRKTIYLAIKSSLNFEEARHKLLKIVKLEGAVGREMELCNMLLESCCRNTTYSRYYALVGQRLCLMNKIYHDNFRECFAQHYSTVHRLDTIKLTNLAMFYAHLIATDALPWRVLALICLTEEDTTSSSRIFIKVLFLELSEHLGLRLLDQRLLQHSIFPKGDHPKNTRYAINSSLPLALVDSHKTCRTISISPTCPSPYPVLLEPNLAIATKDQKKLV
ncbi:hypothetical protein SASPL_100158 [Salvia splendens]|uniref:MI domain-containing protein n=1 Tax=Salvia splendens TaxID=180675 RepID=A0A8X8YTD8_SALSN|nr:hypothetical protein SASPL_100158 [Salvia splendens]